ncbi:hypothetical protein Tco_0990061 [Tanacetum coccineum]|uniref:Uncharacterized protein n=1 Tax=Tanacetum coccineum TaxID=301880 RepID=A0ABQ5EVU0_9ASTR
MNKDYYHEQNFCYNSNSFGFDQFLPQQLPVIDQTPREESMKNLRIAFQAWSESIRQKKKEEEKRFAEEQAAKAQYWKISNNDDDDEEYTIAITRVLPTVEPNNSLRTPTCHPHLTIHEWHATFDYYCGIDLCRCITSDSVRRQLEVVENVVLEDGIGYSVFKNPKGRGSILGLGEVSNPGSLSRSEGWGVLCQDMKAIHADVSRLQTHNSWVERYI